MKPTTSKIGKSAIGVGDAVRHIDTGEVGVVVCQWDLDGTTSCNYIAFFGDTFPIGEPKEKPYILRYYSTSLTKIDNPRSPTRRD